MILRDVKILDIVFLAFYQTPVTARLESKVRALFNNGGFCQFLLFCSGAFKNSMTNVHLTLNFALTDSVVDDCEKSLGSHRLSDLFRQLLALLWPDIILGKVENFEINKINGFFRRLDGDEVVHFWERLANHIRIKNLTLAVISVFSVCMHG